MKKDINYCTKHKESSVEFIPCEEIEDKWFAEIKNVKIIKNKHQGEIFYFCKFCGEKITEADMYMIL